LLESKADINLAIKDTGETPWSIAAKTYNRLAIPVLLDWKADINRHVCNSAPLHPPPYHHHHHHHHHEVHRNDYIPDSRHPSNFLLLSSTIEEQDLNFLKRLIEAKIDVNQANEQGITPLMIATESEKIEMMSLLIEARANINQRKVLYGYSALHISIDQGLIHAFTLLIEAKADVNQRTRGYEGDMTPLFVAAEKGRAEMVELLIESKVNPFQTFTNKDKRGRYSLEMASQHMRLDIVEILKAYMKNGNDDDDVDDHVLNSTSSDSSSSSSSTSSSTTTTTTSSFDTTSWPSWDDWMSKN